jgi:2-succinyl-5-enolpyruvyl-6-hydroxy-3-cyclohexene-1-carboxylate synthase
LKVEASAQLAARPAANRNYAFAAALFEEFVASGVGHVCVCPGSRSAPLAVSAARARDLRVWVHLDERAAAFFALGLARAERAPVALVCSSGTAAANFLPAVVEAYHGRVPLLVLTADRPQEVRGWGAAQTIDQVGLFGSHVRWFSEASPGGSAAGLRHARALACRAAVTAMGPPPGPVHLNLPFREPLDPSPDPSDAAGPGLDGDWVPRGRESGPYTQSWRCSPPPSPDLVSHLLEGPLRARRGVIVCGPGDGDPALPDAVARLGRAAGWPVLAESTSQIRCGPHTRGAPILASFDAILRNREFALSHPPDLVLRIGAPPTSKAFQQWLELHPSSRLVMLDPDRTWSDPDHLASEVIDANPVHLCDSLERRLRRQPSPPGCPRWLGDWTSAETRARRVVESLSESRGLRERLLAPQVVAVLAEALPDGATLFVSNSMAVRELDAFLPVSTRRIRVLANRGANGIDGIVSSALGAAAAASGPLFLLSGDLAFLHDAGGLFAAHQHGIRATLLVVNDDGGGIFSLLPIAAHGEDVDFERLFTVPHGIDLAAVAGAYGLQHQRATTGLELSQALEHSQASAGTQVIEVAVDRRENLALYREIHQEISRSVGTGGSA